MLFNQFLNLVPTIQETSFLAPEAHLKMTFSDRAKFLYNYDYSIHNPRKSAVLSLFYPKDNQTYLLLIVRSKYPGVHSSQISFPGGKMESFDLNLKETALRETQEEVGIPNEKINIFKQCSDVYIPPSNFLVSPFMGVTTDQIELQINTREVSQILEVSLNDLLSDNLKSMVEVSTSYQESVQVPAFVVSNHIIWGATAMILNEIKEIINTSL